MGKQMRIKIKDNATAICLRDAYTPINWEWAEKLKKVEGEWLVVETDYLFKDQFNTAPIPGVSKDGLRIMESMVEVVENDVRKEMVKCRYCGKTEKWTHWYYKPESRKGAFCPNCDRAGYAEALHGWSRTALNMKSHGLKFRGAGTSGDGESWRATMVFSVNKKINELSDEYLLAIVGWDRYYGGPGRAFSHRPWVQRKEKVVIVTQHGGLDI